MDWGLLVAPAVAARTTQLYDRRAQEVTLDGGGAGVDLRGHVAERRYCQISRFLQRVVLELWA